MAESESDVLRETLALLETIPRSRWHRNNVGMMKTRGRFVRYGLGVGSPDIVGCVNGRFVGVECKAPGKALEPEQVAWAREWQAIGAVVVWGDDALEIRNEVMRAATEGV